MLDTSSLVDPKDHPVALFPVETNPTLEIQNTFWGYIIVSDEKMGIGPRIAQSMSWVFGGALAIAAIGMFVLPSALTGDGAFGIKLAAATATQLVKSFLGRATFTVDPVGNHGILGVGNGQDACPDRDVRSGRQIVIASLTSKERMMCFDNLSQFRAGERRP